VYIYIYIYIHIYITIVKCCAFLLTVCWTGWDGTPDDGLQICPKHVEVD